MTETNTNPVDYFKVNVQYIQHTQLLVAAASPEKAVELVKENVLDTTEGFQVNGVEALSDEEKQWVIQNLQGHADVDPSGEVQDTRILN